MVRNGEKQRRDRRRRGVVGNGGDAYQQGREMQEGRRWRKVREVAEGQKMRESSRTQLNIMDVEQNMSLEEKVQTLESEIQRLYKENENLSFSLGVINNNYRSLLQACLQEKQIQETSRAAASTSPKSGSSEEYSNKRAQNEVAKAKVSRVLKRADPGDLSLVVKDGFHWRKYGQKITKDNPSPRAYFKCSMFPDCPVKKKVQRSVEDKSILVVTYEGEHNHAVPGAPNFSIMVDSATTNYLNSSSSTVNPFQPDTNLGLAFPPAHESSRRPNCHDSMEDNNNGIEEYVASLTRDRNFTAALAASVARSLVTLSHSTQM
ncbi:hypothetical protein NE237_025256 [Protea cynaroides]|uniref:WRKY domain-containing protein n=1 Tax=Protea cynaroides TaxID=273540 RepID=A0A9Q0K169_9MAGN|nr:hypothetical protein NE237_025256 [Protea cynaroides]